MLTHRQHGRERAAGAGVDRHRLFRDGPDTIITPLPLYHIFALTANCLLFVQLGCAATC